MLASSEFIKLYYFNLVRNAMSVCVLIWYNLLCLLDFLFCYFSRRTWDLTPIKYFSRQAFRKWFPFLFLLWYFCFLFIIFIHISLSLVALHIVFFFFGWSCLWMQISFDFCFCYSYYYSSRKGEISSFFFSSFIWNKCESIESMNGMVISMENENIHITHQIDNNCPWR